MSTVLSPPEAQVILHNVSWFLYEQLLAEHAERNSPRFAYDRGELEIIVPSYLVTIDSRSPTILAAPPPPTPLVAGNAR